MPNSKDHQLEQTRLKLQRAEESADMARRSSIHHSSKLVKAAERIAELEAELQDAKERATFNAKLADELRILAEEYRIQVKQASPSHDPDWPDCKTPKGCVCP